jgi:hypothetical protein
MTHVFLNNNQLTGEHFFAQIDRLVYGVYRGLKNTFLLRRQHPHGARTLHGHAAPLAEQQPIDW